MSRYELKGTHGPVFVGYDPPLETYFLQVYDSTVSEDENPVFWKGTWPAEITDIADLNRMVKEQTGEMLDATVLSRLQIDKSIALAPTPIQKMMQGWLGQAKGL